MGFGGLVAAGAVGTVGVVEMGSGRRARLLHKVGLADSPDFSVPPSGAALIDGQFTSAYMPAPRSWTLSRPAGEAAGVVYLLHGRGGNARYPFTTLKLHDLVEARHLGVALAAVEGGDSSYWHPRADGGDPLAMLLDEFVPMIDKMVGTDRRALLGWSMGGYGALLAAETRPEMFRAVVAVSPALWTSAGATAPGAFDGPDDYRRHDVFARAESLRPLTVRIDCGDGDSFQPAARRFAALLEPDVITSFGPGFHDSPYWRSTAPAQMETLSEALRA